jgi:carbonic anhydrase
MSTIRSISRNVVQVASVVEDVQRIRNHSLVPDEIPIYGSIYNCKTGKLVEVPMPE